MSGMIAVTLSAFLATASIAQEGKFAQPDLTMLEPAVRDVLEQGLAELRGIQSADRSPREIGAAWGQLGMLYQAHELNNPASACYEEAARLNPRDFRWRYLAAFLHQEGGRFEEALAAYQGAIAIDPDYLPATLRQGQVLAELQRPQEAIQRFQAVIDLDPRNAPALAGIGRLAMAEMDYAQAIRYLEQALAIDPRATRLRYALAMAYRQSGDLSKARDNLRLRGDVEPAMADPVIASMERLSRSAQIYLEKGYAAARAGHDRAAVAQFRKAVEFNPDDPSSLVSLGHGLALIGEYENAMRQFEKAIELDPDNGGARYRRGTLLEARGEDASAAQDYRVVLGSDPGHLRARYRLAEALMRLGEFEQAAAQYDLIEATPDQEGLVVYSKGLAELAAWDCRAAVRSFEKALTLRPDSGEIYQALARSYATCPAIDEARRARSLELAQQLFQARRNQDHAETLAMAAAANGQFEQAWQIERQLLDAVQRSGNDQAIEWHRHLLELYGKGEPADRPWPLWHPVYKPAGGNADPGVPGSR